MAPKLLSPANVAAAAFATALGLLALSQWRASQAFTADAVTTEAEITELRTAKRGILDGSADTFAKVVFDNPGASDPEQSYSAELPTPIDQLGLDADTAVGSTVTIRYDPTHPQSVRYGEDPGKRRRLDPRRPRGRCPFCPYDPAPLRARPGERRRRRLRPAASR